MFSLEMVLLMTTTTPARRTVHYSSFDELLTDAERLVRARGSTTGNSSLDQILGAPASAVEKSIDGVSGKLPGYVRLVGRYIVKPRILKHGMMPGFKLP